MIVDKTILKRLSKRFGVGSLSDADPKLHQVLQHSEVFIKAPAGFEPLITGGGYEWDDSINGYRLGQNQKIFLLPTGTSIWIFKDILVRGINPDSIQKWVSADTEYPMGKANAFFIIYGKLTGQDLGLNETAGDDVADGETEPGNGGGVAMADDENQPFFSKDDIQKMLKGEFPQDAQPKASMDTAVPGGEPGTGHMEPEEPVGSFSGPPPERLSKGEPQKGSEADLIIQTLYKKAKVNPNAKLSKQNPIRLDPDEILDLYQRAKTFPSKDKKKLIAFLKSGAVIPLEEGKISKATLEALMEHIITGIVKEVDHAKKKVSSKKKSVKTPVSKSGSGNWNPSDYSQMDWDAKGQDEPNYETWVVAVANKLWKDAHDIGKDYGPTWNLKKVVKHPTGDYYFLEKTKTVHLSRAIKRSNNKWYYLDPDPTNRVKGHTWIELGKDRPSDEPSIEQEISTAGAAGPTAIPIGGKRDKPLEEMTTSNSGTTGYAVPGAFTGPEGKGGSEAGVEASANIGYELTPIGKQELKRHADRLYEAIKKELKGCNK